MELEHPDHFGKVANHKKNKWMPFLDSSTQMINCSSLDFNVGWLVSSTSDGGCFLAMPPGKAFKTWFIPCMSTLLYHATHDWHVGRGPGCCPGRGIVALSGWLQLAPWQKVPSVFPKWALSGLCWLIVSLAELQNLLHVPAVCHISDRNLEKGRSSEMLLTRSQLQ